MENKIRWVCLEDSPTEIFSEKKKFKTGKKIGICLLCVFCLSILELCMFWAFSHKNASSQEKYAIIILNKDVRKGDILSEKNILTEYEYIGENKGIYVLNSEIQKYLGNHFKFDLEKGTPLLKNFVSRDGLDTRLTQKIPLGKRLFILDMNLGSIEKMLRVGDDVDIVASLDIPTFGKVTETILKKVKIEGIGDSWGESTLRSSSHSISLYLTPEEVKILSFMKRYGEFFVSLRNPGDFSTSDDSSMTLNSFLKNERIQKIIQSDNRIPTQTGKWQGVSFQKRGDPRRPE